MPSNKIYSRICDNSVSLDLSDLIEINKKYICNWKPILPCKLKSAYCEYYNKEPPFTNNAHSKKNEVQFIGTLDYIFYKDICLLSCESLENVDPKNICPNEQEMSDHLSLHAFFIIL